MYAQLYVRACRVRKTRLFLPYSPVICHISFLSFGSYNPPPEINTPHDDRQNINGNDFALVRYTYVAFQTTQSRSDVTVILRAKRVQIFIDNYTTSVMLKLYQKSRQKFPLCSPRRHSFLRCKIHGRCNFQDNWRCYRSF